MFKQFKCKLVTLHRMCVKRKEEAGVLVSWKGEWDGTAMLSHRRDGSLKQAKKQDAEQPGQERAGLF